MIHAFGCSFTCYTWPSWADLINQVEPCVNYGSSGMGNKAIFTRVISALTRGRIQPGDRVIVQWSGHTRYDLWLKPGQWLQLGNVWNQAGNSPINSDFLTKLWSDQDALIQSLSLVIALDRVLKSHGVDYCYLYMTDFRNHRLETGRHQVQTGEYAGVLRDHWLALDDCLQVRISMLDWVRTQRQLHPALLWRMRADRPAAEDLHPEPQEAAQFLQKLQGLLKWNDDQWQLLQQKSDHSQNLLRQANSENNLHPNARPENSRDNADFYPGWPLYPKDHISYRNDQEPI